MPPRSEKRPSFQPKDMVLAKMTGFPAWPSFVMPSDLIPEPILKAKKKTTNTCVIFIPDGDFYWMNEKSLEALSHEKLQAKIDKIPKEKLKSKSSKKSMRTSNVVEALLAANNLQFDAFMEELDKAKASLEEDVDDEEEDEDAEVEHEEDVVDNGEKDIGEITAATDEPSTNKKDHEDVSEEAASKDAKSNETNGRASKESHRNTRRTQRSSEENTEASEPAPKNGRRPKRASSVDEQGPDNSVDEEAQSGETEASDDTAVENAQKNARSQPQARKRARTGRNQKSVPEPGSGSDDGEAEEKVDENEGSEKNKPATESRAASPKLMNDKDRQHQLWLCRIKLQRSLIQRNQPVTPKDPKSFPPPTVDELSMARIILQKLADFPVTVELLRDTKIHKVLKCIVKDEDLEYPDSFRLHEKCKELLEKWQSIIEDLKLGKLVKAESRVGSSAPEESEISGLEIKPTLDKSYAGKVGV